MANIILLFIYLLNILCFGSEGEVGYGCCLQQTGGKRIAGVLERTKLGQIYLHKEAKRDQTTKVKFVEDQLAN